MFYLTIVSKYYVSVTLCWHDSMYQLVYGRILTVSVSLLTLSISSY